MLPRRRGWFRALRLLVGLALLAASCPAAEGEAPAPPLSGRVRLLLQDALFRGEAASPAWCDLELDLAVDDGRWAGQGWASSLFFDRFGRSRKSYGGDDHPAGVITAGLSADAVEVAVRVAFRAEPGAEAEPALGQYLLTLTRQTDRLAGTFEGMFRGTAVKGAAGGTIRPLEDPAAAAGHEPLDPGEHPRLVFRRSDVPALRRRAETPEGRAILQRLRRQLAAPPGVYHAAGHGLLYVLTGDAKEARAARDLVERVMRGEVRGAADRPLAWSDEAAPADRWPAVAAVALAYDFCFDGWDTAFCEKVALALEARLEALLRGLADPLAAHPYSGARAAAASGAGLAALAVRGDLFALRVPRPDGPEPRRILPPAGFRAGKGVPVVRLDVAMFTYDRGPEYKELRIVQVVDRAVANDWLAVGPFPARREADHLGPIGGREQAAPDLGTKVPAGGEALEFRRLRPEWVRMGHNGGFLELERLVPDPARKTFYFYTVIRNEKPGCYKVSDTFGATVWLAGRRIFNREPLRLGAGLYPVMVQADVGPQPPIGKPVWVFPRFKELAPDHPDMAVANWRARHDRDAAEGAAGRALALATRRIRRTLELGFGDRGWFAEGHRARDRALADGLLPFLVAHRTALGEDLAGGASAAEWLLPLYVMELFARDGRPRLLERGGGDGHAGGTPREELWALGMAAAREDLRPALLWVYDRFVEAGAAPAYGARGQCPLAAIYALAHWPLGMAPANPAARLPRALHDRRAGYSVFRGGWKGPGDLVATVLANPGPAEGCAVIAEAGGVRISGLGLEAALPGFVAAPEEPGGPPRFFAVETTHFEAADDGSGAVAMRLEHPATGETFLRSFAVDYSGASGAEGVYVLVDRFPKGAGAVREAPAAGGPGAAALRTHVVHRADDALFAVITLSGGDPPDVTVEGSGLGAAVRVRAAGRPGAGRTVAFDGERIVIGR